MSDRRRLLQAGWYAVLFLCLVAGRPAPRTAASSDLASLVESMARAPSSGPALPNRLTAESHSPTVIAKALNKELPVPLR